MQFIDSTSFRILHFSHLYFNPLIPAGVKFAWFPRIQKCTFLAFYAKFESVPLKIFFRKLSDICKNQFSFDWWYSRISQFYKSAVIRQLFKVIFLFFSKNCYFFSLISILDEWFDKNSISKTKLFSAHFSPSYWYQTRPPLITRVKRASM